VRKPPDSYPQIESADVLSPPAPESVTSRRRPYEKPRVVDHGRLVDVALGGSPGVGDSAAANNQMPPPP